MYIRAYVRTYFDSDIPKGSQLPGNETKQWGERPEAATHRSPVPLCTLPLVQLAQQVRPVEVVGYAKDGGSYAVVKQVKLD